VGKFGGSDIARQLLQQCQSCSAWTLATTCAACGGTARAAAPMKWSPEDTKADLRRRLEGVTESSWIDSLPELGDADEEE
jgi:rRNA maturation protein Nop10